MDAGGRATQGAVAEDNGGFDNAAPHPDPLPEGEGENAMYYLLGGSVNADRYANNLLSAHPRFGQRNIRHAAGSEYAPRDTHNRRYALLDRDISSR